MIQQARNTVPDVDTDGTGGHYQLVETGKVDNNGAFHSDQSVQQVSLLTLAASSTTRTSADQINTGFTAGMLHLYLQTAGGAGGVKLAVDFKDGVDGQYNLAVCLSAALATAGSVYTMMLDNGISGGGVAPGTGVQLGFASFPLSAIWRVRVIPQDASSYTYSVVADMIP